MLPAETLMPLKTSKRMMAHLVPMREVSVVRHKSKSFWRNRRYFGSTAIPHDLKSFN
jgi:hypothetical protein